MTVQQFIDKFGVKVRANRGGWLTCCLYPDHDDRTPSFSVSAEGLFYCWGCHKKGNFARLLHDIAGWSWSKSIAHGDLLSKTSFKDIKAQTSPDADKHLFISKGLLGLYDADWEQGYARYMQAKNDDLPGDQFPPWCFPFIKGFTSETLRQFDAGYDNDFHRVTIPIFGKEHKLHGFLGRTCIGDDMKYMVYPPLSLSRCVYNLDAVLENNFPTPFIILVEGAWDVWMLWQKGITNVAAMLTSRISHEQVELLVRLHGHFVIMFDQDKAGREGAMQVASALLTAGSTIEIAMSYPNGVADLKALSTEELQYALTIRKPYPAPSSLF